MDGMPPEDGGRDVSDESQTPSTNAHDRGGVLIVR